MLTAVMALAGTAATHTVGGCAMMPRPVATGVADAPATIDDLFDRLGDRYDVRFVYDAPDVPRPVWPDVTYEAVADDESLRAYIALFDEEFRKYPPGFIRASGLRTVAFVRNLKYQAQERWAVPDFVHETLYLDVAVRFARDEVFQRRVIHHEFYHLLEEEWNGDPYFKDPAWAALNTPGHRYGQGGAANRDRRLSIFDHPAPGFVDRYAMSGLEEDKAEVWAAMFVPALWAKLNEWMQEDAILRAKVEFLEAFSRTKDASMDAGYWERVRGE